VSGLRRTRSLGSLVASAGRAADSEPPAVLSMTVIDKIGGMGEKRDGAVCSSRGESTLDSSPIYIFHTLYIPHTVFHTLVCGIYIRLATRVYRCCGRL
jgi:hypothetical protein